MLKILLLLLRENKKADPNLNHHQILKIKKNSQHFSEEIIPIQSKSIFRVLDETNKLEHKDISINQNETKIAALATTTTDSTSFGNFGNAQDSFFNLSLSTIFSTRIDDKKTKDEDDIDDVNDEVKDEKNANTAVKVNQEKPRRQHPFPFTSPSYLKSLEKNKLSLSGTKKHGRKRVRSKKNTQDGAIPIRRKSEHWTATDQDEKENHITR